MPSSADLYETAKYHHQLGQLQQAESLYRQHLAAEPNHADALHLLGVLYAQVRHYDLALQLIRRAIAINPNHYSYHDNLGSTLLEAGQVESAIASYQRSIQLNPNYAEAYGNLGVALRRLGRFNDAIECYHTALRIKPNSSEIRSNLGNALCMRGDADQAIEPLSAAVALKPESANAHNNLASALYQLGQTELANQQLQIAIKFDPNHPEARTSNAQIYLARGDFPHGWPEYEWRFRRKDCPQRNFTQPRWNGADLAGRSILLHAEQGVGDTIHFARYAALLKQSGATVIFECQPELQRLIQSADGVDRSIARGQPLPLTDFYCPLLSTPLHAGTTFATIPNRVPYLKADAHEVEKWSARLANDRAKLKIGLAWSGGVLPQNGIYRAVPFELLAPLSQIPNVSFYSLQKGPAATQMRSRPNFPLIDFANDLRDFADTAALMMSLDLIVSVDTAVAHLAGALARPTWTLLPLFPDWRWFTDRDDSPWYPTMRLFRQTQFKDWTAPLANVESELRKLSGVV